MFFCNLLHCETITLKLFFLLPCRKRRNETGSAIFREKFAPRGANYSQYNPFKGRSLLKTDTNMKMTDLPPSKQHVGLTLKSQTKIAADDILIFYFYLLKKIQLDVSSESSAKL